METFRPVWVRGLGLVAVLVAAGASAQGVGVRGADAGLHLDPLQPLADGGTGSLTYRLDLGTSVQSLLLYVDSVTTSGLVQVAAVNALGDEVLSGSALVSAEGWTEFPLTGDAGFGQHTLVVTTNQAVLVFRSLEVEPFDSHPLASPQLACVRRDDSGRLATGVLRLADQADIYAADACPGSERVSGSPYAFRAWVPLDAGAARQDVVQVLNFQGVMGIYAFVADERGPLSWTSRAIDGGVFPLSRVTGNLAATLRGASPVAGPVPVWAQGDGELLLFSSGDGLPPCHPAVRASAGGDLGRAVGRSAGADWGLVIAMSPVVPWCRDEDGDRERSDICEGRTGLYIPSDAGWVTGGGGPIDCDDHDPTVNQRAAERCNGIDDDCDGLIDGADSTFVFTPQACPLQAGLCTGAMSHACVPGAICVADDYGEGFEPVEASCDGRDNDCDGLTDGDDPDVAQLPCDRKLGVCEGARRTPALCTATGLHDCPGSLYGPAFEPTEVSCDGLDNDCDGLTDGDDPDVAQLPCDRTLGVCERARRTPALCTATGLLDCPDSLYGPTFESTETRCDGLDNDCDGLVDEGCSSEAPVVAGPSAEPSGCGCTSAVPGAWTLAAVFLLRRRRQRP